MSGERDVAVATPVGFSGLASLRSDITAELEIAAKAEVAGLMRPWPSSLAEAHARVKGLNGSSAKGGFNLAEEASTLFGFLGVRGTGLLVVGLIWGGVSMCSSPTPKRSGYGSGYAAPVASQRGAAIPQSYSVPATPTVPATPDYKEVKPVVGEGLTLGTSEVRYCVFEDVRISKMEPLVTNNSRVAIFNRYVEDYNSRCASYRYSRGTLEYAQRQAAERDEVLGAEARARFSRKK